MSVSMGGAPLVLNSDCGWSRYPSSSDHPTQAPWAW